MDPCAAAGPCTEILKCAAGPAARHLSYMFHYQKHVDDLKSKVDNILVPLETDLKMKVELAHRSGEEVYQTVKVWLQKAESTKAEISKLHDDALQITSCFEGWSSQRHRLGKEAKQMIVDVSEILKEGKEILREPISYYGPYQSVPAEGDEFESRQNVKVQVFEALKDKKVNMIGVSGMGGIGKTTLMTQILEQVEKEKLFDDVVMATVSQAPKLGDIQTEIAEKLGIQLKETSSTVKAARISARLAQGTSLVFFDDLWKELNLLEVGIPHGCKVVITTRDSEVCNHMRVQASIEVKVLSIEDSRALFHRNAGDYINAGISKQLADDIVDECKGLPLAIVALAKCLWNKSHDKWIKAVKQLKKSHLDDISPVFTSIKYSYENLETKERKFCFLLFCLYPEDARIKIENLLGYAVAEEIFLDAESLCDARDQLNVQIDKLISSCLLLKGDDDSYVMMHDIVRDVGVSIASEESKYLIKAGTNITEWPVSKMMLNCLRLSLMKNDISEIHVTPECPQLLALYLANNQYLTHISDGFFGGMERLVTLDLSGTKIPSLPQSISCLANHLRTLLLNNNNFLKDISGIGSLRQLEILNLSECDLERLPEEMKFLTKLKLLNLYGNENLTVIPPYVISSLTLLEEFYMFESFSHWEIEGEANEDNASFSELLSHPRLGTLHVGTNQDSLMHMDYPHKLKKLSKFNINLGSRWFGESNYSKSLTIKVNDHKPVGELVKALWKVSDELILVDSNTMKGIFTDCDASLNRLKHLKVVDCSMINLPSELMVSLENLKSIKINECNNMKAINSEGDVRQLNVMCNSLEIVEINKCKNMEVLFDFSCLSEEGHANILSKLRQINLFDLISLKKIWKGSVSFESLRNLKSVDIYACPSLIYLFPNSMAHSLQQLEILEICNCHEMVQVFGWEKEEVNEIGRSDPQPSTITARLPRLKSLFINNTNLSNLDIYFPSLQTLTIFNCNKLDEVFKEDDSTSLLSPLLTKIDLCDLPKLTAIWKGLIPDRSFQNLKEVHIYECSSLSYIFPVSAVMSLQQLEILILRECNEIVHIFGSDEEEKEETETEETGDEIVDTNCCMIEKIWNRRRRDQEPSAIGDNNDGQPPVIKVELPRLKALQLKSLIKLSGFCQQSSVVFYFPSLEELEILDCPYLRKLPCGLNCMPKLKKFEAKMGWFDGLELEDRSTKDGLQSLLVIKEGEKKVPYYCDYCKKHLIAFNCLECPDFNLCVECFSIGAETTPHNSSHSYRFIIERVIWKGSIQIESFRNLKEVYIRNCNSLSCIVPISVVKNSFQQLEILQIKECEKMVHIFGSDEEKEGREAVSTKSFKDVSDEQSSVIKVVLPRLKNLRLYFLGKLIGFCQQSSVVFYFPSLEELLIEECADLKRLPFDPNSTPKLKIFEAYSYWFHRLQWDDRSTKARLQSVGKILEGGIQCDYCKKDITKEIFVICVECHNFDLCIECFSVRAEVKPHKRNHPYRVVDNLSGPLISPEWSADEEALLLKGIELHGLVNWVEVAKHVGTKSLVECIDHYPKTKLKMGQSVDPPLARPRK